jgi:DNA polymerase III epsilon subunit-like protein
VDWNDDLVLDLLVKPKEKIIDCNTKFSGLTEEMLEGADCDLEKVSFWVVTSGIFEAT